MYESFIGLEVHIHLLTKTKAFCGCRAEFGGEPNSNVCPVCLGYPGVLPALNTEALRMAYTVARALGCRLSPAASFDRKQYFYPDMPKNYQISQFYEPLGQKGAFHIEGRGIDKTVRITECHLEEDAGKLIHAGTASLVDYNRAGVSLLEIVTEPDMETGEEAELFIQQLRRLVRYLGVCDGNMEEGSLRADANVSINTPGAGLGRKVEIKNLNSSRFVRLGLNYEIGRQSEALDGGRVITQETRLWNENRDQTEVMRSKENANDYRFFPEPDLPVFAPSANFLDSVEKAVCELPLVRAKRFVDDYGLSVEAADTLCDEKAFADYYEDAANAASKCGVDKKDAGKGIGNLMTGAVKNLLTKEGLSQAAVGSMKLTAGHLAEIYAMTAKGAVSQKNARDIMEETAKSGKAPSAIVKERGFSRLTDPAQIEQAVNKVLLREATTLEEVRAAVSAQNEKRKKTLLSFLVGKVLSETGGRADPGIVTTLINGKL
jgi:aspartyl-tRNA(Asn)/glutamyl-tRNA(Gln) amidotransferase subunit B